MARQRSSRRRARSALLALSVLLGAGLTIASVMRARATEGVAPNATLGALQNAPVPVPAAMGAEPRSELPEKRPLLIGVDPTDAQISRDGVSLGAAPLLLELGKGEVATLTVARDGFATAVVRVDASEGRRLVKLAPLPSKSSAAHSVRTRPARAPSFGSDITNPWE